MGLISSATESTSVAQAILLTIFALFSLTAFSLQTKYDFTKKFGYILILAVTFFGFGLMRLFFPFSPILETLYAVLGGLLYSVFILFDTQYFIKHANDDQYVEAALEIYVVSIHSPLKFRFLI